MSCGTLTSCFRVLFMNSWSHISVSPSPLLVHSMSRYYGWTDPPAEPGYRPLRCTMHRLIDDVLIGIFAHLALPDVISISHVDCRFRDIALATPALWTDLSIASTRPAAVDRFYTVLERSGCAPLSLRIDLPDIDVLLSELLFSTVLEHVHRTRVLSLRLPPHFRAVLLFELCERPAPMLEMLWLGAHPSRIDYPHWGTATDELPSAIFGGHAPRLREVHFEKVCLPGDPEPVRALALVERATFVYDGETWLHLGRLGRVQMRNLTTLRLWAGKFRYSAPLVLPEDSPLHVTIVLYEYEDHNHLALLRHTDFMRVRHVELEGLEYAFWPGVGSRWIRALDLGEDALSAKISYVYNPEDGRTGMQVKVMSLQSGFTRTVTNWLDPFQDHRCSHSAIRLMLSPPVQTLEVAGKRAWETLAGAAAYTPRDQNTVDFRRMHTLKVVVDDDGVPKMGLLLPALRKVEVVLDERVSQPPHTYGRDVERLMKACGVGQMWDHTADATASRSIVSYVVPSQGQEIDRRREQGALYRQSML
ncbi:hypothetical protein EXIGLDRAFT_745929 [Exidia glandulosa HHB12029]|uniref:F-box domain-containing protein n=1 Tax=Exidia glandulosa HHB12029 TaxID=1314781 RepID=A0A165MV29_EXIGL|nr:hypothetical protein EXIGLDRAFT_745929 [Exidia glandulosa HHB12029]